MSFQDTKRDSQRKLKRSCSFCWGTRRLLFCEHDWEFVSVVFSPSRCDARFASPASSWMHSFGQFLCHRQPNQSTGSSKGSAWEWQRWAGTKSQQPFDATLQCYFWLQEMDARKCWGSQSLPTSSSKLEPWKSENCRNLSHVRYVEAKCGNLIQKQ